VSDGRANTSRANLGDFVPEALDPGGSVMLSTRVPRALAASVDAAAAAAGLTRGAWIRFVLERLFHTG